MGNARVTWDDLPPVVRERIEEATGAKIGEAHVESGHNCQVAMVLSAEFGTYFLKGVPATKANAVNSQHREFLVAPLVTKVAPRLDFHVQTGGWDVLGFEYLRGHRHPDFSPTSPHSGDLEAVAATLTVLSTIPAPAGIPEIRRIEQRWSAYADPAEAQLLAGDTLCHTDLHHHNILIGDGGAKLVDWAWPTAGAPWLDTACVGLQLIASGYSPSDAQGWCELMPEFSDAHPKAIDVFTMAAARLWVEIAMADPVQWKEDVAEAAALWASFRNGG